jgi:hypothetical protein
MCEGSGEIEPSHTITELTQSEALDMLVKLRPAELRRRSKGSDAVVSEKARPEGAVGQHGADSPPTVTHGITAIARPLAIAIYRAWASDIKHDAVPFEELADCTKDAFLRAAEAARAILLPLHNDPKSSE